MLIVGRIKFLDSNNPPQTVEKPASMQKFKKDNSLIFQASNMRSNNLKLRLQPRLSVALKHIRHPTIPHLHKENVFENDTNDPTLTVLPCKEKSFMLKGDP